MGWAGRVASRVGVGCVLVLGGAVGGFGQTVEIVITEFITNPIGTDSQREWFEIYNAGSDPVDLLGWTMKDDGSNSHEIVAANGTTTIQPNTYLVFGVNNDKSLNGDVEVDYDYPGNWSIGQTEDEIVLVDGSSMEQARVAYDSGSMGWPTLAEGVAVALKATDLPMNVGGNWCLASTAYGTVTNHKGTPGAANDCPTVIPPIDCSGGTAIHVIQGSGDASACTEADGMATTNNNIVTAVGAGGFFIQTPTADSDNDVDTSDGIFVLYDGTLPINVGDQVDVTGTVEEFFGFTRIDATTSVTDASVTLDVSNQTLPAPVEFGATVPSPDPASPSCAMEYECYEGMRIRIATGTVSSPSQSFGGSNPDPVAEMYITPTFKRAFREKGVEYPGLTSNPGIPVWDGNPELFELDPDKLGLTNVSWVPGTTFTATGVLGFDFGEWEIWPTELAALTVAPPLPYPARGRKAGEVTVASLNMLNLGQVAGDTETKLKKLSRYIRQVLNSPDIIGVQEVYTKALLTQLADEIRSADSSVSYTAHLETGPIDINVGFLVRSGVTVRSDVEQHDTTTTFMNPLTNMNETLFTRPPLQLEAAVQGIEFFVIVVHNRSLLGIDGPEAERVRQKRFEQAQALARLAESLEDEKLIIVGDFNAFQFTDGYTDVIGQLTGDVTASENLLSGSVLVDPPLVNLIDRVPEAQRYSYAFPSNRQYTAQVLDHALVNQGMVGSVVGITYARGNADARRRVEEDNPGSALFASDHDGFVVYLSAPGRPAPVAPGDPDGPGGGREPEADLDLDAESQIVSASRVRYNVSIENAGPDTARDVVVTSSFSGGVASVVATTSGCDEDPDGVPDCSLGDILAGDSASFTIDVDTGGASESSLRYSGSVGSETMDPEPRDDDVGVVQPLGPPNAPTDLEATAISSTEIELRWQDNSSVETGFDVFLQGPGDSKLRLIGSVPANTTSTVVDELVPDIEYNFALEARNGPLRSERTPKSTATTWFSDVSRCEEDDVLCLGSFEVEVEWNDGKGKVGRGIAERLTAESGDFWFFDPANIELVVKVLDGCRANGHYWVFAAGLTDVEVTTTVRDLGSGIEMSWTSPQGTPFEPIGNTSAFATCGAVSRSEVSRSNGASRVRLSGAPKDRAAELYQASLTHTERVAAAGSACTASDTSQCLLNSRFEVRANWQVGERSGAATVIPRTADTGMFWFFSRDNVELIVKVLDGCALNGHRWVLMGGLTDVGVEIIVTDSESGDAKMYRSPGGAPYATMFDTTAFSCGAGR